MRHLFAALILLAAALTVGLACETLPGAGPVRETAAASRRLQAAAGGSGQALQAGRDHAGRAVRRRELRGIPQAARRHRRAQGPRRPRQARGGAGLLLAAGQGPRRQAQIRHRQSRQGDRSRRQGRIGLGRADRLCRRADRGAVGRPQGHPVRAGQSRHRSEGVRSADRRDADRRVRMGLSAQGRPRSAQHRQARRAGQREARHDPRAHHPGNRSAERSQSADVFSRRHAERQDRLCRRRGILRARRATRCATSRMPAVGRLPAISAAPGSSVRLPSPLAQEVGGRGRRGS